MKSSKINLRFCKIAPGPILSPEFIHLPVIYPTQILAPIQPIQEVQDNFTVATRNLENLPEVGAEELDPFWGILDLHHVILTFEMMLIVIE